MKKNIMLIIGYLTNGGAERSIINVANELMKYHNVVLVCCSKDDIDYECNAPIIEIKNLKLRKKGILGLKELKRLKKKYKIDVSISYTTTYNFFNVMSRVNDKVYISIRNHLSVKNEEFKLRLLHKYTLKKCDKVICCSKSVEYDQLKHHKSAHNKTIVIENFCAEELLSNGMKKKLDKDEKKYISKDLIVSMARLVKHKGHEHIIKAFSIVVKKNKDAKLLIFGRGPLKADLNNLIKKYNLENNVHLMSFDFNPFRFFKHAKMFILASDYEGFPNSVIEAMYCKLPIIGTSSYGGTIEILSGDDNTENYVSKMEEKEYGILVPSFINDHGKEEITDNEKILANAILNLLNDNNKRDYYVRKSFERIKDFSKKNIINKWLDLIDNN